jgi:hypothetical protein
MDLMPIFYSCFVIVMCLGIGGIAREFGAFKRCSRSRKQIAVLPAPAIAPVYKPHPIFTPLRPPTPLPPSPTPIQEAKSNLLTKIPSSTPTRKPFQEAKSKLTEQITK